MERRVQRRVDLAGVARAGCHRRPRRRVHVHAGRDESRPALRQRRGRHLEAQQERDIRVLAHVRETSAGRLDGVRRQPRAFVPTDGSVRLQAEEGRRQMRSGSLCRRRPARLSA
jgi:hypothetical protein